MNDGRAQYRFGHGQRQPDSVAPERVSQHNQKGHSLPPRFDTSPNLRSALWRSCSSRLGFAKSATPRAARIESGLRVSRAKSLDKAASDRAVAARSRWHMCCLRREGVNATRRAPMEYAVLSKNNLARHTSLLGRL